MEAEITCNQFEPAPAGSLRYYTFKALLHMLLQDSRLYLSCAQQLHTAVTGNEILVS